MQHAHDYAPRPETAAEVHAAYLAHLRRRGRGNPAYTQAARSFLTRWPTVADWAEVPLQKRLSANSSTRPFITFLMVSGRLAPGYDYLVYRKLSSIWLELAVSPLNDDLQRFVSAAKELGFTERVASAIASQIIARLLIQTQRPLTDLRENDLADLLQACTLREQRTGRGAKHYRSTLHSARQILFHLGILDSEAPPASTAQSLEDRMAEVPEALRPAFVGYLNRKYATCAPKTVSSIATRLAHFGRFLAATDPDLTSLAQLDRQRHIEPYLASLPTAVNSVTGAPITVADRIRRVHALGHFLTEITEWGWDDAPARKLIFRGDLPRPQRFLPRYLPVDADRRLAGALADSPYRLAADALLLQRACGLRIGELLDLELDCIHEIPGQGSWLKVPLGKLDSERMVPIDEEVLTLVDRITTTRTHGRPLRHPRTGVPADFLFTHHGKRLSQNALRAELNRAAATAGLDHITPHQLRHTYATALINAGVSLQALMALLGHVSTQMSLRYAHLFDSTVRTEYERALDLAKSQIGPLAADRPQLPITDITGSDWKQAPAIKSRLAGGYCLRAPTQGTCPYANICEHCPSFHTDATHLGVLAAQRVDAQQLAEDAESRGWVDEARRHQQLVARLDTLIANAGIETA
ncbi:tyrosine-type recombinase/integrase [Gordonia polyisoprenivorans]|uniref:tyrosine-type recombinase/integrase n=1 Tax=Gordonia polyisoprenivorans TaxID=84595 RepID=UPI001B8B0CFC|nr:tyrosine-type recombinase/integrase [Gordonia polyisoprenivorans]QUD82695.1 tyrosine-type recombinase/integrase [Gordonia polyisoprenivorans]QUD84147.1 tyrosine-type recombinase/integrase [Gordonia polyisoprenivorans]